MSTGIKVSVVIPVYNAEKYICQCMDSLIEQTLQEIEIICVVDGATDSSYEILKEYALKDERVRVICQENAGAATARNNGIKLAHGKYLSILDADDFFEVTMLEKAYEAAEQHCAEVTIFDVFGYDTNTGEVWPFKAFRENVISNPSDGYFINDGMVDCFMLSTGAAWNKLFLKEFIFSNEIEFQKNPPSDEIYFSIKATLLAHKIAYVNEKLMYYRLGDSSSQVGNAIKYPTSVYKALHAIQEEVEQLTALKNPEIAKKMRSDFVHYALWKNISTLKWFEVYDLADPEIMSIYNKLYTDITGPYAEEFGYANFTEQDFLTEEDYENFCCFMSSSGYERRKLLEENRIKMSARLPVHIAPNMAFKRDSRVVIYGAGQVGISYIHNMLRSGYGKLVAVADKNYKKYEDSVIKVISPYDINKIDYDYILVALKKDSEREKVYDFLQKIGIDINKIIREYPEGVCRAWTRK